jgi:Flp pilus assembly protein TadG
MQRRGRAESTSAESAPVVKARFAGDQSAMAAVEFALILPILITLLFGGIDVTEAVAARRKAVQASSTMSDLIAQAKEVTTADVNNVFTAGNAIMTPFDASRLEAVVSSVQVDANKVARIVWSQGRNASAHAKGNTFTLPDTLLIANSSLVVAEVVYNFRPVIGTEIVGTIRMPKVTYALPRVASKATGVPCKWTGCT